MSSEASKQEAFTALERLCGPQPQNGRITMRLKPDGGIAYDFEYFIGGNDAVRRTMTGLLKKYGEK